MTTSSGASAEVGPSGQLHPSEGCTASFACSWGSGVWDLEFDRGFGFAGLAGSQGVLTPGFVNGQLEAFAAFPRSGKASSSKENQWTSCVFRRVGYVLLAWSFVGALGGA